MFPFFKDTYSSHNFFQWLLLYKGGY